MSNRVKKGQTSPYSFVHYTPKRPFFQPPIYFADHLRTSMQKTAAFYGYGAYEWSAHYSFLKNGCCFALGCPDEEKVRKMLKF